MAIILEIIRLVLFSSLIHIVIPSWPMEANPKSTQNRALERFYSLFLRVAFKHTHEDRDLEKGRYKLGCNKYFHQP